MTPTNVIDVYLDEGAFDGKAKQPAACGVVVNEPQVVEQRLRTLFDSLTVRANIALQPSFESFLQQGFHYANDSPTVREEVLRILPTLNVEWYAAVVVNPGTEDPYDRLIEQFRWILERVSGKYKGYRINCVFEQNSRTQKMYPELVGKIADHHRKYGTELTCKIGTKEHLPLSLADYLISTSALAIDQWKKTCCSEETLAAGYTYRNFASIEVSCSVLYGFDIKRAISSRARRMHENTYYSAVGSHSPICSRRDEVASEEL